MEKDEMNLEFEELATFFVELRSVKKDTKRQLKDEFFAALDEQCENVFSTFKEWFVVSYCSNHFDENIKVPFSFPKFNGKEIEEVIGKAVVCEWIREWSESLKTKTSYLSISSNGYLWWDHGYSDEDPTMPYAKQSYEEIFAGDLQKMKPWDRQLAEAITEREKILFYQAYNQIRACLTNELKPQLCEMARNLEFSREYETEIGSLGCSARICDMIGDEVEKQLSPQFAVWYEVEEYENANALTFLITLRLG